MIHPSMWNKAQALIAMDAFAAWKAAGNGPGKKHKPYRLGSRAEELVKALGADDAEMVASILMYRGGPE